VPPFVSVINQLIMCTNTHAKLINKAPIKDLAAVNNTKNEGFLYRAVATRYQKLLLVSADLT
jgi:hypothetical protein